MKAHKCVICGSPIENVAEEIPFKSRYAHEKCFDVHMRAVTEEKVKAANIKKRAAKAKETSANNTKPEVEVKGKLSEEEFKEKQDYFDYLREMTGLDPLPVKMYKLSEDYIRKYKMTYTTMRLTLVYLSGMENKEFNDNIVGLIPYYYDKAMEIDGSYQKMLEKNEQPEVDSVYKRKVVKIRPPRYVPDLIDLEGLGNEDT